MRPFTALVVSAAIGLGFVGGCTPPKDEKETNVEELSKRPVVVIETSAGEIKAELWPDRAGETVRNFLRYVDEEFYDGLIFHRVRKGFMIQGGGMTPALKEKPTHSPIANEARSDVPNARGTLAMARTSDPHSATAQFFINLVDNDFLDKGRCQDGWGYCVFGKVVEGLDVVDEIGSVKTKAVGPHEAVPVQPVLIRSIRRAK